MRLSGVLGQERAVAQLEAEMAAGRLAHAYLFVGPEGTGRGTAAQALMAALNCKERDSEAPCGQCGPCHKLAHGHHEDFLTLAPPTDAASGQIKVEEVRQVLRAVSFPPHSGGHRVVLIRSAEAMNLTSANLLLKTLEEPPERNILVLTVQDAKGILPTLVSRCRRVRFLPLAPGVISGELERRGVEPGAARIKAALAGGSLGRALELDHESLAAELDRLVSRLDRPASPAADWRFADELVGEHRGKFIDRQGLVQALELMAVFFRDHAAVAAGKPEMALLPQAGAAMDVARAARGFELVRRAQRQILANASPELAVAELYTELRAEG